jgi:hypothetical protein
MLKSNVITVTSSFFKGERAVVIKRTANPVPHFSKGKWYKVRIGQSIFKLHESEFVPNISL